VKRWAERLGRCAREFSGLLLLALCCAQPVAGADRVSVYPAYGDGASCVVEGRVVELRDGPSPAADDGRLRNLWRNFRLWVNDERKRAPVALAVGDLALRTRTDDEGYFTVQVAHTLPAGWHEIAAGSRHGAGRGRLLVVPQDNRLGMISDLDDTILVSEVTSKPRLLANSFLKNPTQRQVVPGMAALYARTLAANPQPESAPLFYLSASPRQLHEAIDEFLASNGFPPGVLITKRVTDDASSDPLFDQFAYKTRQIEAILERLPWVRFILVGDDGERDPEIYDWVRRRHPERVAEIWIRRVRGDGGAPLPPGQKALATVLAGQ
jgi:phosphatidate phosphatase APP1